jgi:hypothetical protein
MSCIVRAWRQFSSVACAVAVDLWKFGRVEMMPTGAMRAVSGPAATFRPTIFHQSKRVTKVRLSPDFLSRIAVSRRAKNDDLVKNKRSDAR